MQTPSAVALSKPSSLCQVDIVRPVENREPRPLLSLERVDHVIVDRRIVCIARNQRASIKRLTT